AGARRAPSRAAARAAALPALRRVQHRAAHALAVHLVLVPLHHRLDAPAARAQGSDRMMRMRSSGRIAVGLLAACLAATPAAAAMSGRLGSQYRYWDFSNGNDLRDVLAYWAARSWHVQLEVWNFVDPDTPDQFRPEVGVTLRDHRKSTYSAQYR